MRDSSILFLAGFFGAIVVWRVLHAIWQPKATIGSGSGGEVAIFWLIAGCIVTAVAMIAEEAFAHRHLIGSWQFVYWCVLGNGAALIAGLTAGLVLIVSLNALASRLPTDRPTVLAALSTGPVLLVIVLYIMAVPGALQRLGLTGIKAAGVEITVSTTAKPEPGVIGVLLFGPGAGGLNFTGYFSVLKDMTSQKIADYTKHAKLSDRPFFYRQALYLHRIDPIVDLPRSAAEAKIQPPLHGVAKAVWQQEVFLGSMAPLVRCLGFYHETMPDVLTLRPLVSPALETLLAIEAELEAISAARLGQKPAVAPVDIDRESGDVRKRLSVLEIQAGAIITAMRKAIPLSAIDAGAAQTDSDAPSWYYCTQPQLQTDAAGVLFPFAAELTPAGPPPTSSVQDDFAIVPPYLAMFIANAYASMLAKDRGLDVLNTWIKYYKALKDAPSLPGSPTLSQGLYDMAVMEYGFMREADEAYPTTTAERYYLRNSLSAFAKWGVDLKNDGAVCGGAVDAALLRRRQGKGRALARDTTTAAARLDDLYANVVQRYLHVVVATRSIKETGTLTPEDARLAQILISSADRCLNGEDEEQREFRQTLNRIEGGFALAAWAIDGSRSGLLRPSEAEEVRQTALRALVTALPSIRQLEHDKSVPDGPVKLTPSYAEAYRRLAEQEILDIEAATPQ